MVASVSKTSACMEISVNRCTSPACPYASCTSGTPIISVLLKMAASATTADRLFSPWMSSSAKNIAPATM